MHANKAAGREAPDAVCDVPCFNGELVERKRAALPPDADLARVESIFAALADRVRLKILHALGRRDELCVCDVAHVTGMTISSTSHHLRKLRDSRILKDRSDGKMVYYSLRDPLVASVLRCALTGTRDRGTA